MADNTPQSGSATIAADDVTTLNGGASSGVLVQRVKVGYGDDGTHRDASTAFPLPTATPNTYTTGTITAANANVSVGVATPGSVVQVTVPDGHASWDVYLSGTFSAGTTVVFQGSIDGTNWFATNGRVNLAIGLNEQYSSTSTDVPGGAAPAGSNPSNWKGTLGAVRYFRVCCTTFTASDSVTVQVSTSAGVGGTFLLGGISDIRGAVIPAQTFPFAAGATGTAGPVDVSRAGNLTVTVKNTIAGTAFTGSPVLVFEQSDDNVSWGPQPVVNNSNGAVAPQHVVSPVGASGAVMFDAPMESVTYFRVRVVTGTATNGMTVDIGAGGLAFSPMVTASLNPVQPVPLGATTGTTPVLSGQVGRVVRANSNAAQATAATLIAAPAAGTRIYVTNVVCSNEGASLTVMRLFAGSLPAAAGAVSVINDCYDFPIAASGGGATVNFPPNAPWALPVATALSFAVTTATTWSATISYYVAA